MFLFPFTEDIYPSAHKPLSSGLGVWLKNLTLFTSLQHRPHMSPQALQPSMIVLLIDWPSLSRLIHLSLYANCPLTRLTRTNRWNKIWCPRTTKREKWESVSCSLPRRSKKKESAEIRSRYCKWSEKGMLCRSCFVAKVNRNIFNQWLDKKKKKRRFNILAEKKCSKVLLQQSPNELTPIVFPFFHI